VVIPQDVALETIHEALKKLEAERLTAEELTRGTLLRDVYAKHGVL
jgi:regulator of RNase E activity RraA